MIYRKTRRNWPGTYYKPLTEKQAKATIRRWRKRMKQGSIQGCEVFSLMLHDQNSDWTLWRCITRIRRDSQTIEVSSISPMPPDTKMRRVKSKPSPVS
tara:strand:+ start:4770 stop:5063 length:294 start_codon:yes stop_codon:yes gene_type:complete